MKNVFAFIALGSLAWTLGCGESHSAGASWGYEGDHGPSYWGELGFSACADGKRQSPIDIVTGAAMEGDLPDLVPSYAATPLDMINNGHTIQVNVASGQKLMVGDDLFDLAQFHFHRPSEHTFDGEHAAMELHLVHEGSSGQLAVVGVMITPGAENPAIATAWAHMPRAAGESARPAGVEVDVASLLPANRRTFRYEGSLTTPACTEGVLWYLLAEGLEASPAQIAAFGDVIPPNSRPVQPLNARMVRVDSTN